MGSQKGFASCYTQFSHAYVQVQGKSHLLGKAVWDAGVCFQDRKNHRPVGTVNIQQKVTCLHACIYSSPLPGGDPSWCSQTLHTASKDCQTEGEVGNRREKYTKWDFFSLKGFQALEKNSGGFVLTIRANTLLAYCVVQLWFPAITVSPAKSHFHKCFTEPKEDRSLNLPNVINKC